MKRFTEAADFMNRARYCPVVWVPVSFTLRIWYLGLSYQMFTFNFSECYHESGHPDTAGQVLNKIGTYVVNWSTSTTLSLSRMLQHEDPPLAAKYFQMTSEFLSLDEKPREAANAQKNALRMYCRARDMAKVVEVSRLTRDTFIKAGMINMAHEVSLWQPGPHVMLSSRLYV